MKEVKLKKQLPRIIQLCPANGWTVVCTDDETHPLVLFGLTEAGEVVGLFVMKDTPLIRTDDDPDFQGFRRTS
jgi:hypothetical protein